MKIKPSHYPIIIIVIFIVSLTIGLMIGFRPGHESNSRRDAHQPTSNAIHTTYNRQG